MTGTKAQGKTRSFGCQTSHHSSLYTKPLAQCLAIWGPAQVLVKLNEGVFRRLRHHDSLGAPLLWMGMVFDGL